MNFMSDFYLKSKMHQSRIAFSCSH